MDFAKTVEYGAFYGIDKVGLLTRGGGPATGGRGSGIGCVTDMVMVGVKEEEEEEKGKDERAVMVEGDGRGGLHFNVWSRDG